MNQQNKAFTLSAGWIYGLQTVARIMARTLRLLPRFREQNPSLRLLTGVIFVAVTLAAAQNAVAITEISIPTASSDPEGIAAGPGDTVWFTEFGADKIGRVSTSTGLIIEYPLPLGSAPLGIAAGPDGNIWFTMAGRDLIGRLNPATGVISEFTVPGAGSQPARITAGPDGKLWFTEAGSDQIGVISVVGTIVEFAVPGLGSLPFGITTGPDGALWFTEAGSNEIGRITTAGVVTNEFPGLPTPQGITTGPDGNLWHAVACCPVIVRLTTGGVQTGFGGFGIVGSVTRDITTGPDGFLWFTDFGASRIDRISTLGVVTEFPTPTAGSSPVGIVSGPDGRIWFTESVANKIGVLNPNNPAEVISFPPILASGTTVSAVEGAPFANKLVATFNASNASVTATNFSATINWGDGTAFSSGTVNSIGSGSFTVTGGHTYLEEGSYNIAVTIHDIVNNFDATANTAADVADAPLSIVPLTPGAMTTFTGVGGNNTSVTAGTANAALNAFTAAIGGANNGANPPGRTGGFRAINWDAVALDGTDFGGASTVIVPNNVVGIPVNRFQERGVEFEEVYAVSGDGFVSVNPGVAGQFPAFSPTKTFAMFNDNTIDFNFVLPSTHTTPAIQAVSRGFGAIFLDVETPNTTSIEYFNGTTSLGKFFVPPGSSGQAEFFGVLFQNPVITNVHIELGTATLFSFNGTTATSGPSDNPATTDLAVTDDFVYAEPMAVPTGININATAGVPFTAKVASFTDADPNGQVSDYSVVIDWGDGTMSAGGVTPNAADIDSGVPPEAAANITPNINGGFDVTGTHTYTTTGTFTITTSIRDIGGASISGTALALVTGISQSGTLQFSSIITSAAEGAGTTTLTVTRTGDTSIPASVNFETNDGTAVQKSDYTFNFGTLQFAPGDTSKTIQISLVNDVFVEGSETFFVNLSNPSPNFVLGTPSSIAVTITDDDTVAPTTNPIDDPMFFVRQHYRDFLGREADAGGLAFWSGQITACGVNPGCIAAKRVDVSASFFLSIEFQETGGYALRIQRAAFGRQSNDPSSRYPYLQFMHDARTIGQGVIVGQPGFDMLLEHNKQTYAEQIAASNEFAVRFPAAPAAVYVDALFASAGVTPAAADRTAAINAFGAGGTTGRVAALRSVADSASLRTAESRVSFVLAEYYGYLRRNPTDAPDLNDTGYQFWLNKLNAFNGNYIDAEMVKAFITSLEYRQRFGP
jgi:streptogramin lyase